MEKSDLKLETLLVNEEREVRGVFSLPLRVIFDHLTILRDHTKQGC